MRRQSTTSRAIPDAGRSLSPSEGKTKPQSDGIPRSLSPNSLGAKSATNAQEFRRRSISPTPSIGHATSQFRPPQPVPYSRPQSAWRRFWSNNKPAVLVALSQLFGATMNLSARLLEIEGDGMHPVQVLLIRQSITSVCCLLYMWIMKTPDFPIGKKEIRWLLFMRGFSGFFGIFGMWYSMMYLPLADATVITFLAPGVAGLICYFALKEPFTKLEQLATLVALLGVVLIAQPAAFFAKHDGQSPDANKGSKSALPGADHQTTPEERLMAVGVALLGVFGAAGAFTTLRAIGKRAHPLISVNFFAMSSTVICITALTVAPILDIGQPALSWALPSTLKQWLLLFPIGLMGFIMQYLLTSGLAGDKSNKANAMVYTHMIFAATYDRWVFKHRMGLMSFLGCVLILGSAIGVVFMKRPPTITKLQDLELEEGEAEAMLGNGDEHLDRR